MAQGGERPSWVEGLLGSLLRCGAGGQVLFVLCVLGDVALLRWSEGSDHFLMPGKVLAPKQLLLCAAWA